VRGLDLPALDRRLRTHTAAPLAVAFSGGGDSLALLLLAKAWADGHGRRLLALTVDHGLNPASAGWTSRCAEIAERLDLPFRALRWEGDKPATGLPAAARAARHALLADAAREAGAKVILFGHTADDLAEAAAMRAEGSTVPDAAEWSPSPAWPEGRGLFLLRPMLGLGRAEIREGLTARGETWIDDPANEDLRFARSRARILPARGEADHAERGGEDLVRGLPSTAFGDPALHPRWGGLRLPSSAPARHVAAACLCAGGTSRPPRTDKLDRLVAHLRSGKPFTATLAGARIESDGDAAVFMRDSGRSGLVEQRFPGAKARVWDGRFEIVADAPVMVRPLKGLLKQLPKAQQAVLGSIPAAARQTLPAIFGEDGVSCPILAEVPLVRVRALAMARFEAAAGLVDREPAV
jgi:tRNA(Ile)-lysidine synthase